MPMLPNYLLSGKSIQCPDCKGTGYAREQAIWNYLFGLKLCKACGGWRRLPPRPDPPPAPPPRRAHKFLVEEGDIVEPKQIFNDCSQMETAEIQAREQVKLLQMGIRMNRLSDIAETLDQALFQAFILGFRQGVKQACSLDNQE